MIFPILILEGKLKRSLVKSYFRKTAFVLLIIVIFFQHMDSVSCDDLPRSCSSFVEGGNGQKQSRPVNLELRDENKKSVLLRERGKTQIPAVTDNSSQPLQLFLFCDAPYPVQLIYPPNEWEEVRSLGFSSLINLIQDVLNLI